MSDFININSLGTSPLCTTWMWSGDTRIFDLALWNAGNAYLVTVTYV